MGPLAPYAEGFREDLLGKGYTQGSAAHQIHLMAHLSCWLEAGGLGPADLDDNVAGQFLAERRADGYAALLSARGLAPLLGYLRGRGVVAVSRPLGPQTPADRLVGRFGEYLVRERGLAADSVRSYTGVARRFLTGVLAGDDAAARALTAAEVTGFVRRECGRRGVASAKATVTGLRALLRFLYLDGQITMPLAGAVPSAAGWQLAALPRAVSPPDLARLMDSCDRRSVAGRRDFAILVLLARLGLRAGEVAALELGDIGWRQGEITVCGKGRHRDCLPLPPMPARRWPPGCGMGARGILPAGSPGRPGCGTPALSSGKTACRRATRSRSLRWPGWAPWPPQSSRRGSWCCWRAWWC
jgi:hypothetical protein